MRANMLSANPEEATAMAKSNLAKAFKLDSTSTEVYAILGAIQMFFDWNFKNAEKTLEKSISLNPNNADAHLLYANLLILLGHPKEALEQSEMASKLDR